MKSDGGLRTRRIPTLVFIALGLLTSYGASAQAQDANEIVVSRKVLQQLRLGIDAERIQDYWGQDIATPLAEMGVKEMASDYVRVAINCAYEPKEGEKKPAAYSTILNMMAAMKTANPSIHFFASPRPLWVSYGTKDGVPWTPYPVWVQEWIQKGTTTKDGKEYPTWKKGPFHVDKLVRYFADYLNLMHEKGFAISFLDLSNEQSIIQPWHTKVVHDELPRLLNPGVPMPELVVPSTWSHEQATRWLQSVDHEKGEHLAFAVVSAHNTGGDFEGEELANTAHGLDKEVWNTEMHKWMGTDSKEEILSSEVLWKHLRAGFNGIDTWMIYGPYDGRGHTMIWVDPEKGIRTSTKYEIYKKLVNSANRGYYLDSTSLKPELITSAFVKGEDLTLWILNTSASLFEEIRFNLQHFDIASTVVEQTQWSEMTPRSGTSEIIVNADSASLKTPVVPESLYFFKLKLKAPLDPG